MTERADIVKFDTKYDGSNIIRGLAAGIISINGDTTPAQLFSGDIAIVETDFGAIHNYSLRGIFVQVASGVISIPVPNDTPTVLETTLVPSAGLWFFYGAVRAVAPGLGGTTVEARCFINNGAADIGEVTYQSSAGGPLDTIGFSPVGYLVAYAGGETITLSLTQHNAAAASINVEAILTGIRIGHP